MFIEILYLDFTFEKKTLAPKYIGVKANNAICKYYLKGVKLSFASQIKKIEYKKDAVILQKNIETWPLSINILKGLPFVTEVKIVSISRHGGRVIVKFLGNKKTFFQATYEKGLFFKNLSNHQYILSK